MIELYSFHAVDLCTEVDDLPTSLGRFIVAVDDTNGLLSGLEEGAKKATQMAEKAHPDALGVSVLNGDEEAYEGMERPKSVHTPSVEDLDLPELDTEHACQGHRETCHICELAQMGDYIARYEHAANNAERYAHRDEATESERAEGVRRMFFAIGERLRVQLAAGEYIDRHAAELAVQVTRATQAELPKEMDRIATRQRNECHRRASLQAAKTNAWELANRLGTEASIAADLFGDGSEASERADQYATEARRDAIEASARLKDHDDQLAAAKAIRDGIQRSARRDV